MTIYCPWGPPPTPLRARGL